MTAVQKVLIAGLIVAVLLLGTALAVTVWPSDSACSRAKHAQPYDAERIVRVC